MHTAKNYRILKKYLVSFALVFLLPSMLIVLFFNTYTTNLISKQSQDRLINQFANYCENVESRMQNLRNIFAELSVDKETSYLESTSSTDVDDANRLRLFTRKLYGYSFANNMIKNINIYYTGTETVINTKGKFSYYYAYDQFLKGYGIPQDDLKKMLSTCTTLKIINNNGAFIAVQSFPIGDNSITGSIVINLNERILLGFSSESSDMSDSLILANKDGSVIAGNGSNMISAETIRSIIKENANIKRDVSENGRKYITMCSKSSVEDLYYLSFIPAEALEGSLNDFNKVMLRVIIVFFIMGLAVVWAFSIFNYTPVKTMLKDIPAGGKKGFENAGLTNGKANEYDIIKMYIDDLCKEKDDLSSRVSIHLNETRNSFLKELVINGCSSDRFVEMNQLLNLNFHHDYFCFVYIVMSDVGKLDANEFNRVFQVQERLDEIIRQFPSGYRLQLDNSNNKGVLLNMDANMEKEQIITAFSNLNTGLKEINLANLKMGIGNIYKGCSMLPQSYREAYETARYCFFYSLDTCTYTDMVKNAKDNYYYPSSVENKLMNCCEVGERDSVEAIINEIITKNFIDDRLILKAAYSLYFSLKGTLSRAAAKLNIDASELFENEIDININDFNRVEDVFVKIKNLGNNICEYDSRPKTNLAENIAKEVINYINENFYDKYMSCANVADKFNISQPYLSVILKKNTGLSYGEYVNKLRIKEAKKLLKENELSINDIADKLGYGSGNGFIRTFKNIEGVTPRQYSNSISDQ